MLKFLRRRQETANRPREATLSALVAYQEAESELPKIISVDDMVPQRFVEKLIAATCKVLAEKDSPIPHLVVVELITNLVHAEFRHPVVTISADGNQMTVGDHGPGVPAKDDALRFGYYGKPPAKYQSLVRGAGTGLPIARQMLLSIDGRITIADNLGGGTVVTVWLPGIHASNALGLTSQNVSEAALEHRFPPGFEGEKAPIQEGDSLERTESYNVRTTERTASQGSRDEVEPTQVSMRGPAVVEALSDLQTKLSRRQRRVLFLVADLGEVGPSTASTELDMSLSTAFRDLVTLEEMSLVQSDENGKRSLTPLGARVIAALTA